MVRVLIADDNLDSLELFDDLIDVHFKNADIQRALTKEAFFRKLDSAVKPFNLILFSASFDDGIPETVIDTLRVRYPELMDRLVVFTTDSLPEDSPLGGFPVLQRPFSLDVFGEVVASACVC